MADDVFLPELRDELSQGDIIDLLPVGAIGEWAVSRTFNDAIGAERRSNVYDYPRPESVRKPNPDLFKGKNQAPELMLIGVQLKRCVVLSNDCVAIAKGANKGLTLNVTAKVREAPLHVAPIEGWPSDGEIVKLSTGPVPTAKLIEEGRYKRYLALPEWNGREVVLLKSMIDLRFITPLKPVMFERVTRIASMTDFGQMLLSAKVFTYFSGRALPAELTCPKCKGKSSFVEMLGADEDEDAERTGTG